MSKHVLAKALLVVTICAAFLTAYTSTATAQSPQGGRIVGRVIERDTNLPLLAKVSTSILGARTLSLNHTQTTEQGEFVVADLQAGKVHLTTKLAGFAVEHQSVSVGVGETKYVEFFLTRVKHVRGVVLAPGGSPLAGANVKVIHPSNAPVQGAVRATYQWEGGDVQTDALGNFIIAVHPDKPFVVVASHPNFLGDVSAPTRVKRNETTESVTLSLRNSTKLSGVIKDRDGNPIQGAQVRLLDSSKESTSQAFTSHELLKQRTRYTGSGADGAFSFDQVNPDQNLLIVLHPRYKPFKKMVNLAQVQAKQTDLAKGKETVSVVLENKQ